jgi:hypothetical protein
VYNTVNYISTSYFYARASSTGQTHTSFTSFYVGMDGMT